MNKSILVIGALGLVVLMLASLFWLRQVPQVKEIQSIREEIQAAFDLERVLIQKIVQSNKIEYRVVVVPKIPWGFDERRQKLLFIGQQFWRDYKGYPAPDTVFVLYRNDLGGGCSYTPETEGFTIPKPKPRQP